MARDIYSLCFNHPYLRSIKGALQLLCSEVRLCLGVWGRAAAPSITPFQGGLRGGMEKKKF